MENMKEMDELDLEAEDLDRLYAEGRLVYKATALVQNLLGFIPTGEYAEAYEGRYGKGIKVHQASRPNSRYHRVIYYAVV